MKDRLHSDKAFFVSGVCCASEEAIIRKKLDVLAGADGYSFSPVTCELRIAPEVDEREVARALKDAGFNTRRKQELQESEPFWARHRDAVFTGLSALLAGVGLLLIDSAGLSAQILLLAAIAVGGWRVFVRALRALRIPVLDMNVLMSLAVVGALLIGKWGEAAAVVVLFSLSLVLESYSNSRTRRAIQSLISLSPDQASVLKNGKETIVAAKEVSPGEVIVIRPGERIPLDGIVLEGASSLNESPITGEATPVMKRAGSQVYAGSVNERGSLKVEVRRRFDDTTLARIVHHVEEAQHSRAPVQHLVDRFARIYTPAVLVIALLVAVIPPLLFGEPLWDWLYRALVLMVIACPCALVISTPVTIVSALAHAARKGALIKGGKHIEALSGVRALAFDKTGTLTRGKPTVTDVVALNSMPRTGILQIAAALEHKSEHHLASAVLGQAARESIDFTPLHVREFEAIPGKGVKAVISGMTYFLGNHQLCEERRFCSAQIEQLLGEFTEQGKTVMILGREGEALGVLAIQDTARHDVQQAIDELKCTGVSRTVLISGDSEIATRRFAAQLGIDECYGGLLPEEKVIVVERLKSAYGQVAMVGDGINDAPALAASSVGIAMGVSGTDAALETSDVVLASDDITRLPFVFRLSKKALKIVKQNIAIALGLKLVFLALSLAGVATLWMAVLADDGATLVVIFNGLRVLTGRE